jgi:hypothetical protein
MFFVFSSSSSSSVSLQSTLIAVSNAHFFLPLFLIFTLRQFDIPKNKIPYSRSTALGGMLCKIPILAINFKFPWGCMPLYYEIPSYLVPYMDPSCTLDPSTVTVPRKLSRSERTLALWMKGTHEYKNHRLKLIAYVAEGPWVVRNMVTGKVCIILPFCLRQINEIGNPRKKNAFFFRFIYIRLAPHSHTQK